MSNPSGAPPPPMVHNHGPEEGRGIACPEHRIDGRLVGECLLNPSDTPPNRTQMTHSQAFSDHQFEHQTEQEEERIRSCHAPLEWRRSSFHSDVQWEVYECSACRLEIYAVGGGRHWWNYEITPKQQESKTI